MYIMYVLIIVKKLIKKYLKFKLNLFLLKIIYI